jgi:hypothetical protein
LYTSEHLKSPPHAEHFFSAGYKTSGGARRIGLPGLFRRENEEELVYDVPRKGPWSPRAGKLNSHTITLLYRRFFYSGMNLAEPVDNLPRPNMKKNSFTRPLWKGK